MNSFKKVLLLAVVVLLAPKALYAQQKYHIHEDVVKPSMTGEYESILAEVSELVKANPLDDVTMLVMRGNNNHYYFIRPINNMAELDKPSPVVQLAEKAGKDKVWPLFSRMDKCYDVEKDYILTLNSELSYMPSGITQTPEGENYREHYKIYVTPANRAVVREKMQAIKNLFSSKGSKMYYRVYESGFGTEAEYYMVSVAAKDEYDMGLKGKANDELLGADIDETMYDMFQNVLKIEEIEAEMRPEFYMTQN
jgi:hypothetical protein